MSCGMGGPSPPSSWRPPVGDCEGRTKVGEGWPIVLEPPVDLVLEPLEEQEGLRGSEG